MYFKGQRHSFYTRMCVFNGLLNLVFSGVPLFLPQALAGTAPPIFLMPLSCAQHSPQLKMCPCEFASMTTTGGCTGAYCAHLCVGNNCGSKSRSGCKHMHRPLSHPLRTYNVSKLLPAADTDFCIQAFYKFAVPISNNTDTRPFPPFWTIGRVMRRCALRLEVHRRRLRQ